MENFRFYIIFRFFLFGGFRWHLSLSVTCILISLILQRIADRPGKYRTYNAHQSSIFTYERVAKAGFNPPFLDDRQYCRTLL